MALAWHQHGCTIAWHWSGNASLYGTDMAVSGQCTIVLALALYCTNAWLKHGTVHGHGLAHSHGTAD